MNMGVHLAQPMVRGTIGHLTGQGHIYAISDCIGAEHQGPTLRWVGHDYVALLSPDEEHSKGIENAHGGHGTPLIRRG
jgi:hypothetical protein